MKKRCLLKGAVVISIILGTITPYVGAAGLPSASELVDKYTQALDSTSSFIEDYEKTTEGSSRSGRGSSKQKSCSRGQLRYDKQRIYEYEYRWGHWGPSTYTEDKPHYIIGVVNSEMNYSGAGCRPGRVIRTTRPQDLNITLAAHFGVSYIGGYIGSYDERLDAILRKADRISVRRRTERVRGSRCFVIVADTKYGRYTVWLDTEHGFHPAKVFYKRGEGNYCYNHLLAKGDTANEYLKNVRFEKIDGLWVPMEADSGQDMRTAQGHFSKDKWHYKRTQIVLNPDHDKLGSFDDPLKNPSNDPELKNGTRVHIRDVPTKYTWQDGKVVDKNGREADINNPPAKTEIPQAEPKKELQSRDEEKDLSSDRSGAEAPGRYVQPGEKSETGVRILNFPTDRSLGRIMVQDSNLKRQIQTFHYWVDGADWYEHAEYLGEAQGDIVIGAGKRVGLFVNEESGKDLSALARLEPDDLYYLSLSLSASNSAMRYVTDLTGLRVLQMAGNIDDSGMRNISKLKSLEQLRLSGNIGNAGLRQIVKLPSLKRLYFYQSNITDEGLAVLSRLSTLEELSLGGKYIGDAALVHLTKLPSLTYLMLWGENFRDAGLVHLKNVPSLKILNLQRLPITDAGLRQLSGHTSLENLNLHSTEVTDRGLQYLKSMPSLKKLDIGKGEPSGQITDDGMLHLARITSLEYLDLPNHGITDKGLAKIARLKNLKHLWVCGSSKSPLTDTALQYISSLEKLEYLLISGTGFTDAGMDDLAKLTSLRELNLQADSITNEGLARLKTLKLLEKLSLSCKNVTISGLSRLNALGNISSLDVRGIKQDNSGLDIAGLSKLEALTLSLHVARVDGELVYDAVGDEDLACLAQLENLKSFQLGSYETSMITDEGSACLKNLTNMERLGIGSPYLTDKSLSYLKNMKKLNHLTVTGNFTGDGLRYLENLKGLRYLSIYSAENFSSKALRGLRDSLPNLHPRSFHVEKDRDLKKMAKTNPKLHKNNTVAPSFALTTIDGKDIRLEDYRGKVVMLYFWATWCRPCVAGTPKLKKGYENLKASFGDDFEMISLSMDVNEESVREHVRKYELTWPQAHIGLHSKISSDYGVNNRAPKYFLIGPDGKLLLTPESPQVDTKPFIDKVLKNRKP